MRNAYAFSTLRPTPPVEINLQTNVSFRTGDLRVVDCMSAEGTCWRRSASRDYVLALQDSQSLNVTTRASVAISTELSLQAYMQIFAAGGQLRDYRALYDLQGERPKIRRGEGEVLPSADEQADDRFSFATINANVVLRWELFPGNTVMAVYTRAQREDRAVNRLAWSGLRRGEVEEIFLLKFTIFTGL